MIGMGTTTKPMITLYTRNGCHLCAKAKEVITELREEFDFDYLKLDTKRKIKNTLKNFFEFDGRTKILELESSIDQNKSIFDNLKQTIKKSYEL